MTEDPFAAPPTGQGPQTPPVPQTPPPGYGAPMPYGQQPPPPGYGPQQWGQPPGYAPGAAGTNGFAIASLVCSIGTLFLGFTCVLGVVFGHIARKQIRATGQGGAGLALAGLIIGYVFLGLAALLFLAIFALFAGSSHGTF